MGVQVFPIWNPLSPPSPSHSGSSKCTSPKHPVSCIEPDWQFISHMILYMFQCHSPKSSHSHPLPQSPKDCFCCLACRVIVTIFLNSIYICVSILYWCFSFWLTSLCIIGSSFIHLIRTDSNVFFLMAESYSIVYMYHSFVIHSSADGHLGCFHVLAIINSAVMKLGYTCLFQFWFPQCICPAVGLLGKYSYFIKNT